MLVCGFGARHTVSQLYFVRKSNRITLANNFIIFVFILYKPYTYRIVSYILFYFYFNFHFSSSVVYHLKFCKHENSIRKNFFPHITFYFILLFCFLKIYIFSKWKFIEFCEQKKNMKTKYVMWTYQIEKTQKERKKKEIFKSASTKQQRTMKASKLNTNAMGIVYDFIRESGFLSKAPEILFFSLSFQIIWTISHFVFKLFLSHHHDVFLFFSFCNDYHSKWKIKFEIIRNKSEKMLKCSKFFFKYKFMSQSSSLCNCTF